MQHYQIKRSALAGEITIPPSKSHTLRAILFAALAKGQSSIVNYLPSNDSTAMIEACRLMGAHIIIDENAKKLIIIGVEGKISVLEDVIDAGNSGIVLRFCTAVAALASKPAVITGDYSIRHKRPMKALLSGLSQLGVKVQTMRGDDYAPVIIQGPFIGGSAVIDGEDSQPVSALLIAAAFASGQSEILVNNAGEKPWIDLTLSWFKRLGIEYEQEEYHRFVVKGNTLYSGFNYNVPGDFSSAAFPLVSALISGSELILKNVDIDDVQGDKEIVNVLRRMGAHIDIDKANKQLSIKKGSLLKGISIDINDYVDAITILAVAGCFAEGETVIYNGAVAKQKECDRIHCITTELKKLGADITATADGIIVRKSRLQGTVVHSHDDHRMAMSLAVAGLGAEGLTTITAVDCVSKTYPSFFSDMRQLGVDIKEERR